MLEDGCGASGLKPGLCLYSQGLSLDDNARESSTMAVDVVRNSKQSTNISGGCGGSVMINESKKARVLKSRVSKICLELSSYMLILVLQYITRDSGVKRGI